MNTYSKLSIKRPVLLKTWSEFFQKVSIKRPGPSQKKMIVPFHFRAAKANFWSLLKDLVWIFGKKSLLNSQYYLFFKIQKPRTTRSYNRDLRVLRVYCPNLCILCYQDFQANWIHYQYFFPSTDFGNLLCHQRSQNSKFY